jgi:LPS export ABC transporter protein LptC
VNRVIRRPGGFVLPLGALVALAAFLVFNPLREDEDTNAEKGNQQADYELYGSRIDRLDDAGQLSLRLFTKTASHLPSRAGTLLTEVTLLQPNEQAVPNRLQAPSGFIPDDQSLPMRLAAPVRIEIQDRHGGLPWQLETGELEYRSQTQQLHSSAPVTLTQGDNRLAAQALDADLRQGQVVLLGQVRARYVP